MDREVSNFKGNTL